MAYYFAPPILSFRVCDPLNAATIIAFLTTSAVITRLVSRVRKSAEELRRREASLAGAQKLSHTGSFGWRGATGEILWSDETYRIFQYDRTTQPTVELILRRVHPEDATQVKQTIERVSQDERNFEHEYRLVMPDGSVKYVRVVAHALSEESGSLEFVGAVTDITERKRAEEALRRSESYLAEAQRLTHTGSWAWRVEGREALHLSEEWYRVYGWDPEEGMPTWEERLQRVHPEDRAKWQGALARAIVEKSDYEVEFRILLPDGTVKHIHTVGHPVFNASGDLVQFVGSSMDISERKRAEVLLAGEKRLLEMIASGDSHALILEGVCRLVEELASGSLSSILLLDPNANCLRHGAAPSLPITYTEVIDGLVIGPSVGSCGTAAYRAEPVIVSDIATDPLWADYRDLALAHGLRACWSRPILSSAGRVLGTFATYYREPRRPSSQEHNVIERITNLASIAVERKEAEEKLRQSEAHLFEAQRLSHTGSIHWNVASGEVSWSEETFRIFEYDSTRTPSAELHHQRIHPYDRAVVQQTQDRQSSEAIDVDIEYRLLMPDGRVKHLRSVARPLHDSSSNLEYVAALMDMTATKQGEEALRQAQADLAHVSRVTTMGELTASLAHEVNQPIAAAVTDANTCMRWLTRDQPDLEEAREAASRIVKDAKRATEIVSRIRLLFEKGTPVRELVDVNEVIREMIVLLRDEATRHSISIRTELTADLRPVMGDRVQLQQVVMNLIMNSIDALNDVAGPRELAIRSQPAENEELMVSVSDTGVGLPAQQVDQIFNAFFTTKPHGTGMGLRISHSIVEAHGGRLWAADNSPRGASFYFALPISVAAHE
jgi:PAS domain S-box-containing protein